jgi:hypothetical protein
MTIGDVGQPSLTTPGTMTVIAGTMTGIAKHIVIVIFSIVVIVIAHSVNRVVVHIFALTNGLRGTAARGRTHQASYLNKGGKINQLVAKTTEPSLLHFGLALCFILSSSFLADCLRKKCKIYVTLY